MNDLEWLGRNVHKWPIGYKKQGDYGWHRNGDGTDIVYANYDQWLAERARLQNKPKEWESDWLFQDKYGWWHSFDDSETPMVYGVKDTENYCTSKGFFKTYAQGIVLGDWRDTLEKRSEQFRLTGSESIPKHINCRCVMTEVKQEWDGEGLPPVGTVCECGDVFDGFKSPFKTGDIVKVFGSGLVDGEEECLLVASTDGSLLCDIAHFTNFRPLRSKENSAIKEIETMINKWLRKERGADNLAKKIYKRWVKNQDAAE